MIQAPRQEDLPIVVVRTGCANLMSVVAALQRCGVQTETSEARDQIEQAARLVLPGVGAFGAVMAQLRRRGLVEALAQRIKDQRPTLAICLGLQVLAMSSEESPGVPGLGVLQTRVRRLSGAPRIPQLGWNHVEADAGCRLLTSGAAYFANSYCLTEAPDGWSAAWSYHGGRLVAAIERGPVLACQLHPELSGAWGQALLERWLEESSSHRNEVDHSCARGRLEALSC